MQGPARALGAAEGHLLLSHELELGAASVFLCQTTSVAPHGTARNAETLILAN